ncbi:MAG: hypothetical protein K2J78_01105, partial [Muribaculaceae bacterium]|nr:hypothetical protein [Muribaculaceae bacterium]
MENFKQKLLALCTFLTLFLTAAAAPYAVKGEIADSIGNPESFATIRIYTLTDTVKPLLCSVAGEDGKFLIDLTKPGDYKVN